MEEAKKRVSRREWAADKLALLLMPVLLGSLAAYLGRVHFVLELATHFRVFYLGVAVGMTLLLAALRSWRWAAAGLLVVAVNAAPLVPVYWPREAPEGPADLKIFCANVLTSNEDRGRLMAAVREARPDVVVLIEVDRKWVEAAGALEVDFPHSVKRPQSDNFGIALYSRLPFVTSRVGALGDAAVPAVEAVVEVAGRPVTVLAVHALPPGSRGAAAERNAELMQAADLAREAEGPVVVCGDFNATPWSPYFRDVVKRSGLVSARQGFGVLATWPTEYRPFMIPLDHFLVSPEVGVKGLRTGPEVGSDHLPLVAELVVGGE